MSLCMCDRVTLLYSRKLTEHYKPAMTEKIKVTSKKKKKKERKKRKAKDTSLVPELGTETPALSI